MKKGSSGKDYKHLKVPGFSFGIFAGLIIFSFLFHFMSIVQIPDWKTLQDQNALQMKKVKVRLVQKKKPKKPDESPKKILETKQEKTEAPDVARYQGYQDHKTDKETKAKKIVQKKKALDPGEAGKIGTAQETKKKKNQKKKPKVVKKPAPKNPPKKVARKLLMSPMGKVSIKEQRENRIRKKYQNNYTNLLPTGNDLNSQVKEGYQDYIDDQIEEGDKVDINTSDYRYISYFTGMRKAIELVWNYPVSAARRGHQGVVGIQFVIYKNGKVKGLKLVSSSGYRALDNAILEAIRLSSPFSPLPDGFKKSKMVVTGNFRYVLNGYAAAP